MVCRAVRPVWRRLHREASMIHAPPSSRRASALLAGVFAGVSVAAAASAHAQTPGLAPPRAPGPGSEPTHLARLTPADEQLLAPAPRAERTLATWSEALSLVRSASPDYRQTIEALRRAEAQTQLAVAGVLPTVAGQVAYSHQFLTTEVFIGGQAVTYPPPNVWNAGAVLTWPLANPRSWYAIGTARRGAEVARDDLADKRRTIAQSLVTSMLGSVITTRAADLNRVGMRAALERLALARAKMELQIGTDIDVDRAAQDVETARLALINGDESLRQSREALALAVGSATPMSAPESLDLTSFQGAVAGACRMNHDIEQRPDVAAARGRVVVAERSVRDVYLQFMPSAALVSQAARSTDAIFGAVTTWSAQGVITIPIWDGARYANLRNAQAVVEQARQALVQARLAGLVAVAQAERAVQLSASRYIVAQHQRELAQRIDQRTREAFVKGLGTSLDLVTAAQSLRAAEINFALTEVQRAQAGIFAVLANADCLF